MSLRDIVAALGAQGEVQLVGSRPPRWSTWERGWFAEELAALRSASAPEPAAVLRALGERPEAWLELPLFVELQWEADFSARYRRPVGCLGGLCMRSLLDAWNLRDDPDWRPPWTPAGEHPFLVDIDNYHGNGDFTVAVVEDGDVRLHYCDGHEFHRLAVAPIHFARVGLQALGWPSWQLLFAAHHDDPCRHERDYLEPMLEAPPRWYPGGERDELMAAVRAWRERNPCTGDPEPEEDDAGA